MKHVAAWSLLVGVLGCASRAAPPPRSAPPPPPVDAAPPPSVDAAVEDVAEAPPAPDVAPTSDAPTPPEGITVTGRSDLPEAPASMNSTTQAAFDREAARVRPLLSECLRPVIPRVSRGLRVRVGEDGSVRQSPPQTVVLSLRVASCVDGVLASMHVEPAPPRELPLELTTDPVRERPSRPR